MKVLRIIPSMDPSHGGPCQGIRNSIPEQKKQGVENEVLCFDTPDAKYLGKDDFTIHTIGPAKGPYCYCPNLKKWLFDNAMRFDAIIVHGLWLYNSYGAYKVWKKLKRQHKTVPKLFVMPHGMLDPYFQKAKERRLKAIRNWIFWKLIERKVVNNADGVLFTCEQELILAREAFSPYHPKRELNIGYGILTPPVYDKEIMGAAFFDLCPEVSNKPFLLFLSRIHQKKGTDLLIKAYLRLKQEMIDIPSLVIAGPGLNTPYGEELKKISGSNNNIYFPGMLSGNSKWGAFYNCEAFVLPSHQENFGIAIVEAMACSKAVLISDKVNIWREIEGNKGGIVAVDTEEGAYNLLKKWLSMSDTQKIEMGECAKSAFQTCFSVGEAAKKMTDTIGRV